ncbi:hypothetical protein Aduo_012356 [Ancylostoma duodenale]
MTVHWLAWAIQARTKYCYKYVRALKVKEAVELEHPELFTSNPGCSVALRYRQGATPSDHDLEQRPKDEPSTSRGCPQLKKSKPERFYLKNVEKKKQEFDHLMKQTGCRDRRGRHELSEPASQRRGV